MSPFFRVSFWAIGVFLGLVLIGSAVFIGPYALRVECEPADPEAGYYAPFYLYVPPEVRRASAKPVVLLVQPNNSGTNSDDSAVHQRDAWWTGFERKRVADELGVALLVPAFVRPGEDWHLYTHALDRDVFTTDRADLLRLDLQLLAMIDRARARLGEEALTVEEKVLVQGFSASGMFANRFATLHPSRVLAVAAGSPGGWPIAPVTEVDGEPLPYPAGIADLEALAGAPFDSLAYRAMPQLVYMGTLDDNDSVDFRDGWDEAPAAQVDRLFGLDPLSRWSAAEALYRQAGADARFELVEGVGHDRRELQHLSTAFFREILAAEVAGLR
jgi:dienelactone hydrolase